MNTLLRLLIMAIAALGLAGCSGLRLVESQVRASAAADAAIESGARYRFERLPSQTDAVETESVEAIAEAELAAVGLVRDDAQARYAVQLSTRMEPFLADDWGRPYGSGSGVTGTLVVGTGSAVYAPGTMVGLGMRFPPSTQYRHELTLLLRELSSGRIVYETRAVHEGPWNDRYNILRAVLAAALKDFPHPPSGSQRVKVEIPR